MKKIPQVATTDDLLKAIESDSPETSLQYKNDMLKFIQDFNLQPGEEPIRQSTLFSIYKVWSKSPILKKEFLNEMAMFFEKTPGNYFLINNNAIKLTHEVWSKFKREHPEQTVQYKKKLLQNFLDYYSLTPGDYHIKDEELYELYKKFYHDKNLKSFQLKFDTFCKYADKELKQTITVKGKYYSISRNVIKFIDNEEKEADSSKLPETPEPRS